MQKHLVFLVAFATSWLQVYSLECYVCTSQEHNDDKCTKTVNTCLQKQTACRTMVEWRFPQFWTPGGTRIYYISKQCDKSEDCNSRKEKNNKLHCKRDWWNDWTCYDCCFGDKCNYYVTLGAGNLKPQYALIWTLVICSVLYSFV